MLVQDRDESCGAVDASEKLVQPTSLTIRREPRVLCFDSLLRVVTRLVACIVVLARAALSSLLSASNCTYSQLKALTDFARLARRAHMSDETC